MDIFQMQLLQKLFKFGIVGLSGMGIDFSTTWLCKEKIRINKYIANTAGFTLAAISNFIFNYVWTFKANSNNVSSAFRLFILFALIGLVLNTVFVYLLNGVGKLNFYISKILAIVCVFAWNFSANYFLNFHS